MIFVKPEQRIADQEAPDFVTAVVEHQGVPVRVLSLSRIRVFIQVSSVKVTEAGLVFREMRRDPVQNHSDSLLMKVVDEIHEVVGRSKPAGGGKVADSLVSPGTIERMLHDRKQFHVRETRIVNVLGQKRSQFAVGEPAAILLGHSPPGSKVYFI